MNSTIGRHVNVDIFDSDSISRTIEYLKETNYKIIQFFVPGYYSPKYNELLEHLVKELIELDIRIVIHGSYTINLCHPMNSTKGLYSITKLINEMKISSELNKISNEFNGKYICYGVIIHMGKNIKELNISMNESIDNFKKNLDFILKKVSLESQKIILETGAGIRNEISSDYETMSKIIGMNNRLGLCIDTCHVWVGNYADLETQKSTKQYLELMNKIPGGITIFHLNDSIYGKNSRKDRHAPIGKGTIPLKSLKTVVKFAINNNIPLVLETIDDVFSEDLNYEMKLLTT